MSNDVALSSILAHHARQSPSRAALIVDGVAVFYGEMDARSNQRARMLAARGVGHGDFVTVALPNGRDFYETTFALWKPHFVARGESSGWQRAAQHLGDMLQDSVAQRVTSTDH